MEINVTEFTEMLRLNGETFDSYDNPNYRETPEEEVEVTEALLQLMGEDWRKVSR
jgi:hypothetical protein